MIRLPILWGAMAPDKPEYCIMPCCCVFAVWTSLLSVLFVIYPMIAYAIQAAPAASQRSQTPTV